MKAKRRAKSIRRLLGSLILVFGVLIIVQPWLEEWYYDRKSEQVMKSFLESVSIMSVLEETEPNTMECGTHQSHVPEGQIFRDDSTQAGYSTTGRDTGVQLAEEKSKSIQNIWPVEATLSIPKIDFLMPVICDVTEAHLNVSVSSIADTPKPWEQGNYVIAGHRSSSYGRHFNRLNELAAGDEIIVSDIGGNQYRYRVYKVIIVHESEVWVLDSGKKNEITLITCDPIYEKQPETRLVVKAER